MSESTIALAVLPFKNRSNDAENEFFCDGITEEIISALSKIEQLKVTSRTSSFYFKNKEPSLQEITEKLGVDILVEGSVRLSTNTLRIQTQLIDVKEDTQIWSESWDREKENLFEVQDEISLLIADKLRENEGHLSFSDHLVERRTDDLNAYEQYLKGRFYFLQWNAEGSLKAIEYFQKAIEVDPKLIEAHLGLTDSYSFLAVAGFAPREESWEKAIHSIEIAKKIDADNEGLNYMLANQAFFTQADYATSVKFALASIRQEPTFTETHRFLSFAYSLSRNFKKAKEHILYAKSIDPLNAETKFFEANLYYRNEEFEKSEPIIDELLKENDKNLPATIIKLYLLIHKKKTRRALEFLESFPQEMFAPDERLGLLAIIEELVDSGSKKHRLELERNSASTDAHHAHSYWFILNSISGNFDASFKVLEHLFKSNSSILLLGFSDPLAKAIRKDPRYQEFEKRVYPDVISASNKSKKKTEKEIDKEKCDAEVELLERYLDEERPYLNPALSLRGLADEINLHPNHLSWLLNVYIGKNFNEYINSKRISYFKESALDPDNAHISLLGLGFESGFNSKTSFNTAFKKETGMTPSEFIKTQP